MLGHKVGWISFNIVANIEQEIGMSQEDILTQFDSLPPNAQQQVLDFIAVLKARYADYQPSEGEVASIAEEGFIGMWRDREDMQDSTAWVRRGREREWVKQGG